MKFSKPIYYILSFTWGILVSLVGAIYAIILLLIGKKPEKYAYGWYFRLNRIAGGLNLGPISIIPIGKEKLVPHEFGHSIQNCFFGPFMIFIVIIPSIVRFWYRRIFHVTQPPYDTVWFEGQATRIGNQYFDV